MADQYIQNCLLSELVESKTNPRRHRNAAADEELRNSILEVGVLEPILVRAIAVKGDPEAKFEIVAGSRRFNAAAAAGLKSIPAILKTLTDAEAMECAIVENLQRADVHPLDEADGFAALLESQRYTIAAIALKVGKSESYVAQRLSLRNLQPKSRKLLDEDTITVSHALVLARLPKDAQLEALRFVDPRFRIPTVNELASSIEAEIQRNLSSAPFKRDDETLLPAVGSCNACPKRSDFQPALFPESGSKGQCLEPKCFAQKVAAHIERTRAALKAEGEKVREISRDYYVPSQAGKSVLPAHAYKEVEKKHPCESAEKGIVMVGKDTGKVLTICTDSKCPVHGGRNGAMRGSSASSEENQLRKKAKLENDYRRGLMHLLANKGCVLEPDEILPRLVRRLVGTWLSAEEIDEVYLAIHDEKPKGSPKTGPPDLRKLLLEQLGDKHPMRDLRLRQVPHLALFARTAHVHTYEKYGEPTEILDFLRGDADLTPPPRPKAVVKATKGKGAKGKPAPQAEPAKAKPAPKAKAAKPAKAPKVAAAVVVGKRARKGAAAEAGA